MVRSGTLGPRGTQRAIRRATVFNFAESRLAIGTDDGGPGLSCAHSRKREARATMTPPRFFDRV